MLLIGIEGEAGNQGRGLFQGAIGVFAGALRDLRCFENELIRRILNQRLRRLARDHRFSIQLNHVRSLVCESGPWRLEVLLANLDMLRISVDYRNLVARDLLYLLVDALLFPQDALELLLEGAEVSVQAVRWQRARPALHVGVHGPAIDEVLAGRAALR